MLAKKLSILFILILFISAGAISGCGSGSKFLPSSEKTILSPWPNYEKANNLYDKIIPGETTLEDLKKLGIDPKKMPNIEILTFSDFIRIYLPNSSIQKSDLDEGLQKCLDAKNKCFGYDLSPGNSQSKRIGSFWKDFFGFNRTAKMTGWQFKGRVVIVDSVVVYKERAGGKPLVDEEQKDNKPLGPFQNLGGSGNDAVNAWSMGKSIF